MPNLLSLRHVFVVTYSKHTAHFFPSLLCVQECVCVCVCVCVCKRKREGDRRLTVVLEMISPYLSRELQDTPCDELD